MLGLRLGINMRNGATNRPILQQIPNAVAGLGLNRLNNDVVEYINGIPNGDFSNGTTGWTADNSNHIVIENVLSNTADGTANVPRSRIDSNTIDLVAGEKYFIRGIARVTNSVCNSIQLRFGGTTGSLVFKNQDMPTENVFYPIYDVFTCTNQTGKLRVAMIHTYVDASTANGKIMEIDGNNGVIAISMSNTRYEDYTADEMNVLFPFVPSTGKTVVPQKPIRVFRDADMAETDIGLIGNKLDTASLLAFADEILENVEANFEQGTIDGTNGLNGSSSSTRIRTKYLPINAGVEVNKIISEEFATFSFHFYDNSFAWISVISGDTATTPANVAYVRFAIFRNDGGNISPSDAPNLGLKVTTNDNSIKNVFVVKGTDQSNNGNNAIQSVAANCPRIVNNGVLELDDNGNYALYYDGVDDYFDIVDNQGLDITSGGLSLVAKHDPDTVGGYLISRNLDNTGTFQYSCQIGSNSTFNFILNGAVRSNDPTQLASSKISIATYDDISTNVYLGGTLKDTDAYSTVLTSQPNIQIGCRSSSVDGTIKSVFYQGKISDIIIFNRALTQTEVTKINSKL